MIQFNSVINNSTTGASLVTDIPLPLAFGDIEATMVPTTAAGSASVNRSTQFKVATDVIEGTETYVVTTVLGDDAQQESIKKVRVSDAQAGYIVVGVAPKSVVESEFDNYQYWRLDGLSELSNIGGATTVLYRGVLKVSRTQVYTPTFLSTTNVQFRID